MKLSLSYICANTLIHDTVKTLKEFYDIGIHIDLMDGHFVPRLGVHPEIIDVLKEQLDVPIDVHCMMTANNHAWKDVLSSSAEVIYVHYEAFHSDEHALEFLEQDKRLRLAFKPHWTLQKIYSILDHNINYDNDFLLMAYNPGITNQDRTYNLDDLKNSKCNITIDGGVDLAVLSTFNDNDNIRLVAGSKLIFNDDYYQNIGNLLTLTF
jgi:ribulose-phosphate 3-epimerase